MIEISIIIIITGLILLVMEIRYRRKIEQARKRGWY